MNEHRYNIALMPPADKRATYINLAQDYFHDIHAGYLLGEESLPHITLAQFACTPETAHRIRQDIQNAPLLQKSFIPKVKGLTIQRLDRDHAGHQSAELSVARTADLVQIQRAAAEIASRHGLSLYNHDGEAYRPHLTLSVFAKTDKLMPLQLPVAIFDEAPFVVALGEADNIWQYSRIMA